MQRQTFVLQYFTTKVKRRKLSKTAVYEYHYFFRLKLNEKVISFSLLLKLYEFTFALKIIPNIRLLYGYNGRIVADGPDSIFIIITRYA